MSVLKTSSRIALAAAAALALGGAFFFLRAAPGVRPAVTADTAEDSSVTAPPKPVCADVTHYSYFSTQPVFDQAYADATASAPDPAVKAILFPHHLLAARFIAESFGKIATDRAVTVVLISPNHFSAGRGKIITTAAGWRTPYGELAGDCEAVTALASSGAATVEEEPFEKEHGVSGIVPFIKRSLPNARVVPIIVRDDASDADLERFIQAAGKIFGGGTLFAASFDFSHDMTDTAAQFHDRKSLAVVEAMDGAGAKSLDIDSMPGIRLSMRLIENAGASEFTLLEHSNSSKLTVRPEQTDVTSYLAGVFTEGKKTADDDVTLLAFGDLMLARSVEAEILKHGPTYPFEPIARLLKGSDVVTANAEGVFVDVPEEQKPAGNDDLRFPFEPSLLPYLKRLGFTHLGEANNHGLNYGRPALEASRELIRQAGLGTFGDPSNMPTLSTVTDARGRKIAQIGYDQFGGHGPEDVLAAIAEAKKSGAFTVVYPHWGIEYEALPTQLQVSLAHQFIDAGADAVIGSHPHVIEPIEVYKGKAVFYSLGNFIFDQGWDGPTSQGLAVGLADGPDGTTFYLMPIDILRAQASLMGYEKRSTLLQKLADDSNANDVIRSAIATGIFTLKHKP